MEHIGIVNALAHAHRQVVACRQAILRQRLAIADLERSGHDTYDARLLLAKFETKQDLSLRERDRLLDRLASAPARQAPQIAPP